jgi:hypothetical protein
MFDFLKRKLRLTPADIADTIIEALEGFGDDRQEKIDWIIVGLEEREKNEAYGEHFQRIRAELYRRGVRHSNHI